MDIKPIRTKADYRAALKEIETLMNAGPGTPEGERLDVDAVVAGIARGGGKPAGAFATVDEMVTAILSSARSGDVVVAMSNGAFGGIWGKVLAGLGSRESPPGRSG